MKEHEEIHNPTIIFRGLTDSGTAVAALNASVSSASMNATLMNPGFCEDDDERMTKTHNQEDLEYENTQRALEQEIPK